MSNWQIFKDAVAEADEVQRLADARASDLARILRGRLRRVNSEHLVALKRELREFDAGMKAWKS